MTGRIGDVIDHDRDQLAKLTDMHSHLVKIVGGGQLPTEALGDLLAKLDALVAMLEARVDTQHAGSEPEARAARYPLDRHAPARLWEQVRDHLAGRIRASEFDGRLPKRWELAKEYGVSPETVGRALRALVEQGILVSRPGTGPRVSPERACSKGTTI